MLGRFPHLSKVMIKILEIGGAGCASAVASSLLGSAHEPAHPPAVMPPAVVRLAPADEQMIKRVRDESAALVEKLRTATDAHSAAPASATAASPAPAATVASPKPAKTVSGAAPRAEARSCPGRSKARSEAAHPRAAPDAGDDLAAFAAREQRRGERCTRRAPHQCCRWPERMAVHADHTSSLASVVRRVNVAARCAAPTGRRRRVRIELDVAVKRTPGRYKLATGSKNGNVSV